MATPAEVVADAFSKAKTYAQSAETKLEGFVNALNNSVIYQTPTIDITWAPVEAPAAIDAPPRPGALDELETEFDWDPDGSIAADKPAPLTLTPPTLEIDEFTEPAPTITFPDAPTVSYGPAPTVPTVTAPTLPDAPTLDDVAAPSLLTLTVPTFAGLDLHEDLQAPLQTMPSLALVAPTPYSYTPGPEYTSTLLAALKAKLEERLAGGTGLPPAAEAAIWNRGRDREIAVAQAQMDEVTRTAEALGYQLPPGVVAAQLRRAQVAYYDRVSGLSRDIAIKQADLEQLNLRETITAGLSLEAKLIDYSWQLERIAFESAQKVADNAIQIHNARVEKFRADIAAYGEYRQAVEAIIRAELAKVEELKAKIALEQAKADFNRSAVEAYKAQIEAGMQRVKVYEAQVGAARTLIDLEGAKIAAAGEQIKAYVAQINGETAKVEAYKAGVQAELGKVQVYGEKARAFTAVTHAQAEKARAELSYYEARIRAKAQEWDAWRARVSAESERFRALAAKSGAVIEGFRAEVAAYDAQQRAAITRWETQIKQYEAQATYTMHGQKLNADIIQANRAAILDAAKVGAQTYAQLTASAWNIIHASAGVSAGSSNSVSWNYSNDTTSAPSPVTTV